MAQPQLGDKKSYLHTLLEADSPGTGSVCTCAFATAMAASCVLSGNASVAIPASNFLMPDMRNIAHTYKVPKMATVAKILRVVDMAYKELLIRNGNAPGFRRAPCALTVRLI